MAKVGRPKNASTRKGLMEEMKNDVLKGKSKADVRLKYMNAKYAGVADDENFEALSDMAKGDRFKRLWMAMLEQFAEEFEANKQDLKSKFIARYLDLYEEARDKKKIKEAKSILDSMAEMTGMKDVQRYDVNILKGDIEIKFGFNEGREEE